MERRDWIYETMMGEMEDPFPGVENAFDPGNRCAELYDEIYAANRRLCRRLGVDEDTDAEIIINNFFEMNRELCLKMYRYGLLDGSRK